jgi:hypothetical protein
MPDPTDDSNTTPPSDPNAGPLPAPAPVVEEPPPLPPSTQDFDRFKGLVKELGSPAAVKQYLGVLPLITKQRKDDEAAAEAAAKKASPDVVVRPAPKWAPKTFAEEEARKLSALTSPELKRAEEILKENGLNLEITVRLYHKLAWLSRRTADV